MPFTQETFAPVGANSTNAPAIFSYRTPDTLADIQATGYFAPKVDQLNEGDLILVNASDGYGIGGVQADQQTIVVGINAQNSPFCTPVTQTLVRQGAAQTLNINGLNVFAESLGNLGVQDVIDSGITYQSATKANQIEVIMNTVTPLTNGLVALVFSDQTFATAYAGVVYNSGANQFIDIISGLPLVTPAPTASAGYRLGLILDSATGIPTLTDSVSVNEPVSISGSYNNGLTVAMSTFVNGGLLAGEQIDYNVNYGSSAFGTIVTGDRHCD